MRDSGMGLVKALMVFVAFIAVLMFAFPWLLNLGVQNIGAAWISPFQEWLAGIQAGIQSWLYGAGGTGTSPTGGIASAVADGWNNLQSWTDGFVQTIYNGISGIQQGFADWWASITGGSGSV